MLLYPVLDEPRVMKKKFVVGLTHKHTAGVGLVLFLCQVHKIY